MSSRASNEGPHKEGYFSLTFASASQFHVHLPHGLTPVEHSVLNVKGRHFQPGKGHDCKTLRNLREGSFEALVSSEVMSSISGIKTTSVGCSHQQPATGAGTLPMFSLSPPTAQPSQPSPAQLSLYRTFAAYFLRCFGLGIVHSLGTGGEQSQPSVCRNNTRVTH